MLLDYQAFLFSYRRASYGVYLKYGINKFELQFLLMLSGYLRCIGKQVIAKNEFFDTSTGNPREHRKMLGYLGGCLDKRFIGSYEYIKKPGSLSIGISNLGLSVISHFEKDLLKYMDRFNPRDNKAFAVDLSVLTLYRERIAA